MKTRLRLFGQQARRLHDATQESVRWRPRYDYKRLQLNPSQTASSPASRPNQIDKDINKRLSINTSQKDWAKVVSYDGRVYVDIETREANDSHKRFHALFLRDACTCSQCVDSSSTQKKFSTTEIPEDINLKTLEATEDGLNITWENDIPGYENHVTYIPSKLLERRLTMANYQASLPHFNAPVLWAKSDAEKLAHITYDDYIKDDKNLFKAVKQLQEYGLVFLKGVPNDEKAVERIAERIGNLRDSFYGRTWNVKSVPQAKNVAYTKQYLGLHMDLLYMALVPGFQFLHCLSNSASGGSALFSDSYAAFNSLPPHHKESLIRLKMAFHYDNDGHYYERLAPLVELHSAVASPAPANIRAINYSPPFQAPLPLGPARPDLRKGYKKSMKALKAFAKAIENENNLFEYRYEPGDCVIFNNRRVLHGRREFDPTAGERWLKGCYVDTDVFNSRLKVLSTEYASETLD